MPMQTEAFVGAVEYDEMLKEALTGFLSDEKEKRDASNEVLTSRPFQQILPFLADEINNSENSWELRRVSAVLLRKLLLIYRTSLSWECPFQADSAAVTEGASVPSSARVSVSRAHDSVATVQPAGHGGGSVVSYEAAREVKRVVGVGLLRALTTGGCAAPLGDAAADQIENHLKEAASLKRAVADCVESLCCLYEKAADWSEPWELLRMWLATVAQQRTDNSSPVAPLSWRDEVVAFTLLERLSRVKGSYALMEGLGVVEPLVCGLQRRGDDSAAEVRSAAVRAAVSCVIEASSSAASSASAAASSYLTLLGPALVEAGLQSCKDMQLLWEVTEAHPKLWSKDVEGFLNRLGEVVVSGGAAAQQMQKTENASAADEKDEEVTEFRCTALNVMVAMVSNAPKWSNKNPRVVEQLLKLLFQLSCHPSRQQTEEEFANRREEESAQDEEGSLFEAALNGVSEIVEHIDGRVGGTFAIELAWDSIKSKDRPWNDLFARLMFVHNVTDAKPKSIKGTAGKLTEVAITLSEHANVRVRWASLSVLSVFMEKLGKKYQAGHHRTVLHCLTRSIRLDASPRCRCRALTALCLFLAALAQEDESDGENSDIQTDTAGREKDSGRKQEDEDEADELQKPCSEYGLIEPYVKELLEHAIIPSIEYDSTQVKELGLAAASVLAQCCGYKFTPYYDLFMTAAKNILTKAGTEEMRCLSETSIEMAGQLCVCVGPEKFAKDADWLMSCLMSILSHELQGTVLREPDAGVRFSSVVMENLGRIASCMGDSFLPYLDTTVKQVIPSAMQTAEVQVKDTDFGKEEQGRKVLQWSEQAGVTTVDFRDHTGALQSLSINTGVVEEKKCCLELLSQLSTQFTQHFSQYASGICELLHRDMNSTLKAVRDIAFETYPSFLSSLARLAGEVSQASSPYSHCMATVVPLLTAATAQRKQSEVASTALPCLRDVLESLDAPTNGYRLGILEEEATLASIFEALGRLLFRTVTDEMALVAKNAEKEDDADDWENVGDDEEGEDEPGLIYDGIMHCVSSLFHVYGPKCSSLFQAHLKVPFAGILTAPSGSPLGKVASLCVFAEAINCGGSDVATTYSPAYLPVALEFAQCTKATDPEEEDADVMRVQAAAFGIGVVAERAPDAFTGNLSVAMTKLSAILTHDHAHSKARRPAADCAAHALLKIYHTYHTSQELKGIATPSVEKSVCELVTNWFPLQEDNDEQVAGHGLLLRLFSQRHEIVKELWNNRAEVRRFLEKLSANTDVMLSEDSRPLLTQLQAEVAHAQ